MLLLPYRAKNPPEHFPVVTTSIIALNVIIYALTSERFLRLKDDALDMFAVSHVNMDAFRIITSMFLHGSIMHLLGNMLFLWIFGAAVEGRIGHFKFLVMYLLAGVTGDVCHDLIFGHLNPEMPSLGASGAIMGIAGAYLYMFPYSSICIFYCFGWGFRWRIGVTDWQARWVVLLYIGQDLLWMVVFKGADGVGHMAHLGGFAAGLLVAFLFRAPRDDEDMSVAQATHAEVKDFTLLSLQDLDALVRRPTQDVNLLMAYLEKAVGQTGPASEFSADLLKKHARQLSELGDPGRLASILLRMKVGSQAPSALVMRTASQLETKGSNDAAVHLYRHIYTDAPQSPEAEVALYRHGQILENAMGNRVRAMELYAEMLSRFPNGELALKARRSLQKM